MVYEAAGQTKLAKTYAELAESAISSFGSKVHATKPNFVERIIIIFGSDESFVWNLLLVSDFNLRVTGCLCKVCVDHCVVVLIALNPEFELDIESYHCQNWFKRRDGRRNRCRSRLEKWPRSENIILSQCPLVCCFSLLRNP